jgi:PAS domain S-box-containing protein
MTTNATTATTATAALPVRVASRPRAHPRLVTWYTGLLLVISAAVAWVAGDRSGTGATWQAAIPLAVLLVGAGALRLRFQFRDDVEALDLFEAVLLPVVFTFPAGAAVLMAATAKAGSQAVLRVQPRKAAFNVAQWACATAVAAWVVATLRTGSRLTGPNLAVVLLAMVALMVVNHLATIVVLRLVGERSLADVVRELSPVIVPGWMVGGAAALALGVVLVAALQWRPWVVAFSILPLGLLHLAGRGYTEVQVDRRRLEALHRAAQVLATPVNPLDAIPGFLAEVRHCFQAEQAEVRLLVDDLMVDGEVGVYRSAASGCTRWRARVDDGTLASLLMARQQPARVDRRSPDVAAAALLRGEQWRDCLAVPLTGEDGVVGILVTYNRTGLAGFPHGEQAVLEALAEDLRTSLEKARLVEQVLDERSKLAEIVSRTSDGIATVAAGGTITSWNPAMEAITGYSPKAMVGTQRLGVLRPRDAEGRDVLLERFADLDGDLPATLQILAPTGQIRWISCTYSRIPARADEPEQCIIVARDITEAHQLDRLKQEFVSTVSHELRTPLAPILGWASTLLSQADRISEEQQRVGLESILRQGQRLERLILNLLEVSRIEEGSTACTDEPLDVVAVASAAIEALSTAWPDRTIEIEAPAVRCVATGNGLWVEQILTNLISNALKYAPGPDPIVVRISRHPGEISVAVIDRGPGIPEHLFDRVFERFERFPQADTQAGTGLGLYIARQLALAIRADLRLESRLGQGSTFTLTLRSPVQLVAVG